MERTEGRDIGFFDVITDKQAYLSMIYLMLSFPLGILYISFIATGFLMGLSLIPVFIGVPVLYVFMASVKYLMKFERKMALVFLGMNIDESTDEAAKGIGLLRRFRNELFDRELWKGLTYLTLKFFMGAIVFCLCISLAALSLGLIAAPFFSRLLEYNLVPGGGIHLTANGLEAVSILGLLGISASPQQEMLVFILLGVFVGVGSMHLLNRTAYLMGDLLRLMSPRVLKNRT